MHNNDDNVDEDKKALGPHRKEIFSVPYQGPLSLMVFSSWKLPSKFT